MQINTHNQHLKQTIKKYMKNITNSFLQVSLQMIWSLKQRGINR